MKRFLFLSFAFLLSSCGTQYPLTTDLKLQINSQPAGRYSNDTSATLKGLDDRKDPAVVIYQLKGDPEIRISNQSAAHILVTRQLAAGLQEQGLVFEKGSPVHIELDIKELVATVTRPKFLYNITAKSSLSLNVNNRGVSLTKTYKREADRQSVTRPPVQDPEQMLNRQLSEIVNQILQDEEVRETISKQ